MRAIEYLLWIAFGCATAWAIHISNLPLEAWN